MIIENFKEGDRPIFCELCKAFYESQAALRGYDNDIAEKTFLHVLDKHENLWGVMLREAETFDAVGYALITSYWSNEDGGNVIVLDELYIREDKRKKGYAKLFMEWLEMNYSEDAAAITLEVLTSNQRACELYEKSGYHPDGFTTYTKPMKKSLNNA